jgi:hypothetical protein
MAIYDFTGLKLVEYDTAVGMGTAISLGVPLASSPLGDDDVKQVPTGKGTNLYAGKAKSRVYHTPDLSKYAALDTIQQANTEIYFRETDLEDNTQVNGPGTVMVKIVTSGEPGNVGYVEITHTYFSVT